MAITQLAYDLDDLDDLEDLEPDPTPNLRQAPTIPDEVAAAVEIRHKTTAHFQALSRHYDLPDLLGALIVRPAWMADALCREHPEVTFYPERGGDVRPAKAICDACLVRDECDAYTRANRDEHCIWGGTSGRTRIVMNRSVTPPA